MSPETILQELEKLYKVGEYPLCAAKATEIIVQVEASCLGLIFDPSPTRPGIVKEAQDLGSVHSGALVRRGWCYYKMEQFDKARADASAAKSERGDELLAQIAASVDKDYGLLEGFLRKWPNNAAIANAWVQSVFSGNTTVSHEAVQEVAERFGGKDNGRAGVNVIRNAGAFFLRKSRGKADLEEARKYIQQANELWGTGGNFDHRASAYDLLFDVQVQLCTPRSDDAIKAAMHSFGLWYAALEHDPTNTKFQEKRRDAWVRLCLLARSV